MYVPGDVVCGGILSMGGYCPWGDNVRGMLSMGDNVREDVVHGGMLSGEILPMGG